MRTIPIESWERRGIYEYYSRISNPFYMVTFRQDVTNLYRYVKAYGLSFYQGLIWACTQAVNDVSAFRITMREGSPVLLDRRDPSFTDLKPGAEQFHIVTMDNITEIDAFCREATRLSREQEGFIDEEKEGDTLIYFTCLPWIDLTALTNERDMSTPEALADSIPRIAWGKFIRENERISLGISLEVNHRFIDGLHIGRFAQKLTEYIDGLEA